MTNINVSILSVPRTPRNKRIYADGPTSRISIGQSENTIDTQKNIQANLLSYDSGDFSTREITVAFQSEFISKPVGWVKAYRYESRPSGGYYISNAVFYVNDSDWLDGGGFTIIVEDYESLAGLFVEYEFVKKIENEA